LPRWFSYLASKLDGAQGNIRDWNTKDSLNRKEKCEHAKLGGNFTLGEERIFINHKKGNCPYPEKSRTT